MPVQPCSCRPRLPGRADHGARGRCQRRVLGFVSSFTNLRGGDVYASLIRKMEPKPLRVFLQDGTTFVSYGEFARVGDRVIFSMPLSADPDPLLHVVNLAADRVDWVRTNHYAESTRASRYLSTRAEADYIAAMREGSSPSRKLA